MFVLLRNKGTCMDKRDEHWIMIKHGDEGKHIRNEDGASNGYFRSLKAP